MVIGVAGGIAAYKACQLVRLFKESGTEVHVIPTENALNFVGKATFEALSGNPVSTSVFEAVDQVQHVRLGKDARGLVIAPATADLIARMASGRADDLLTSSVLVATCPIVVVPAMHTEMWFNPATQDNVASLRRRGIVVMEPARGRLTGVDSGAGRLPEPSQIFDFAQTVFAGHSFNPDWVGKSVVITAGGTQENLDPVRFLGNRSSGRQGFALAELAAQRGANVTVIAGSTEQLPAPIGAEIVNVVSTTQMKDAVDKYARSADILIMAAAVADFRPVSSANTKLKKGADSSDLNVVELVENPDILAGLVAARAAGQLSKDTIIVGFAAETGDDSFSPLEYAEKKFARKGCDLLMANDVSGDRVFGRKDNEGWILRKNVPPQAVAHGTKFEIAAHILNGVNELLAKRV
ncbi:MAG: bifunctional phosphopantothenoylcysteine decarboxylase/phosphopantothenate--cysteine ligase CoaBC [Corynebacterium sp.]|nr:bifunctional phosphopantothenoylcysteine decarboxylase/phosphopantothenate--cysteine ligase CoaBC [Corynebacterium sp.]